MIPASLLAETPRTEFPSIWVVLLCFTFGVLYSIGRNPDAQRAIAKLFKR